ncbi:MAG: NAD(P)H-hydrate epimerase [Planctomycetia bacterium]|nr:NAD(P)H-hydrate epimerase [Planctomycetia bacterium]
MVKTVTREEMRELDRKAIGIYEIPGIILMENAGRNVAEEVLKMTNTMSKTKVAVLCGKGNNGGDGFVAARHLHNCDIPVSIFLVAKISDILKDEDTGTNLKILLHMKVPVQEILLTTEVNSILMELCKYDIIIDALFGTGLSGDVREPFKMLIDGVNHLNRPVVSVDIPSGLDCNNGNILGTAIKATKTVTFAVSKRGFYLGDGLLHTGEIIVTDICIPKELLS